MSDGQAKKDSFERISTFSATPNTPPRQFSFGKNLNFDFGASKPNVLSNDSSFSNSGFTFALLQPMKSANRTADGSRPISGTSKTAKEFPQQRNYSDKVFGSTKSGNSLSLVDKPTVSQLNQMNYTVTPTTHMFESPHKFWNIKTDINVIGTKIKFHPVTDIDPEDGVSRTVSAKYHCITTMEEYKNKSLEELRLEDYTFRYKGAAQKQVSKNFVQHCSSFENTFHRKTINQMLFDRSKETFSRLKELDRFKNFLTSGDYSDITIVATGKNYKLHKCVLASCSDVFDKMFQKELKEINLLEISDVRTEVLDEFFSFIYTGQVNETAKFIIGELLTAAEKYCIEGLKTLCEEKMCVNLTVSNAVEYLKLAVSNNAKELKTCVISLMSLNLNKFVHTTEFIDFGMEHPELLLEMIKIHAD